MGKKLIFAPHDIGSENDMEHIYKTVKLIRSIKKEQWLHLLVHISVWLMLFLAFYLFSFTRDEKLPVFILLLYVYGFIIFYLNYLLLTPRYLLHKKYLLFSGFMLTIVLFSFTVVNPVIQRYAFKDFLRNPPPGFYNHRPFNRLPDDMYLNDKHARPHEMQGMFFLLFSFLIFSSLIRIFQKLKVEEDMNRQYQHEKINAELMMLRQQVNPHFLFNSLNNILSLANRKSDLTVEAIAKLSAILRHMLSDKSRNEIPVTHEIELIYNYIELQRLWSKNAVQIDFVLGNINDNYCIEPFILNPLVENAFKYGTMPNVFSIISIHVKMVANRLYFHSCNSIIRNKLSETGSMGIGVNNVIRRLELCYSGDYNIEIAQKENKYLVDLSIKLKENELYSN